MKTAIRTAYICEHCGEESLSARYALYHEFRCLDNPRRLRDSREMFGDTPMRDLTSQQREYLDHYNELLENYIQEGLAKLNHCD